jgi:FMN-dependent NADH-azoreductase
MKLLEIQSSPRGESSDSIALTTSFIEACESSNTSMVVDTLNVWHERLTATSDLDIALFAPTGFTRETARDL